MVCVNKVNSKVTSKLENEQLNRTKHLDDTPANFASNIKEPKIQSEAKGFDLHQLELEEREKKATKADDAVLPLHLWMPQSLRLVPQLKLGILFIINMVCGRRISRNPKVPIGESS